MVVVRLFILLIAGLYAGVQAMDCSPYSPETYLAVEKITAFHYRNVMMANQLEELLENSTFDDPSQETFCGIVAEHITKASIQVTNFEFGNQFFLTDASSEFNELNVFCIEQISKFIATLTSSGVAITLDYFLCQFRSVCLHKISCFFVSQVMNSVANKEELRQALADVLLQELLEG